MVEVSLLLNVHGLILYEKIAFIITILKIYLLNLNVLNWN